MVLAGPWIVVLLSRRVGARWLVSVTAPTLIVVVPLAYLAAASFYYWTQEHRFDPYLQNPGVVIDDIERPRAGDELRVVALGGSTTESSELPEPERYPARLQGLLSDAYVDRPINVVNAGRDWWTTKHSLIHYVTHVRRWRPDVVTVMHAVNDLYRSFASDGYALGEYTASWGHFYGPAIQGARPPTFLGWLLGRTSRLMFLHWYSDWRIRESGLWPRPVPLDPGVRSPFTHAGPGRGGRRGRAVRVDARVAVQTRALRRRARRQSVSVKSSA